MSIRYWIVCVTIGLVSGCWSSSVVALTPMELRLALERQIIAYAIDQYPGISSRDVQISIRNFSEIQHDADKGKHVAILFQPNNQILGITVLSFTVLNNHLQEIQRSKIITDIAIYHQFGKTKKLIRQGERITSRNTSIVYETIKGKPLDAYHFFSQIQGKEASITLGSQTYLTPTLIKSVPIIPKGKTVTATLKKENIELKFKATTLEDGFLNKPIRFKSLYKDFKTMEGEVIDSENIYIYRT